MRFGLTCNPGISPSGKVVDMELMRGNSDNRGD